MPHPTLRISIILMPIVLALAPVSAAVAQPGIETKAVNGIKEADGMAFTFKTCDALVGAYAAATEVVGALSLLGAMPPEVKGGYAEDIVSKALGVEKNTGGVAHETRIPDFRKGDKWYEVKNVKRQGWTKQLADTWAAASKSNKTYTIVTRVDTQLSEKLKKKVLKLGGKIRILKCLPALS